jgi:hypothetical protein
MGVGPEILEPLEPSAWDLSVPASAADGRAST